MRVFSKINLPSISAMVIAMVASAASGQEVAMVTLKALDGSVVITGELQGYDAGFYHLNVAGVGPLSVAEELVTCQSASADCTALVGRS